MKASKLKFAGARVIKTGIAVFITAFLCLLLELPAVYAVITAIVSIEPTASDSIRKGLIRFPASGIGAALAVLFVAFFGETPFTYASAAVLTILLCHSLKLYDGYLVAVLTAVAMIPTIHDNYFLTFLSRLGTTSIGLIVATLINTFVLPPKFTPMIQSQVKQYYHLTAKALEEWVTKIKEHQLSSSPSTSYIQLQKVMNKTNQLTQFQLQEWKFHKGKINEIRSFHRIQDIILLFQRINLHLGNLQYLKERINFSAEEIRFISKLIQSITTILLHPKGEIPSTHYQLIDELDTRFKYVNSHYVVNKKYHHHFSPKTVIYYELLSLHDTLEELEWLHKKQHK
ncbi:aromatic acid exporter family protein [Bacillus alkalicellulosilyticus]|uniref:aromatic acid exporter family protein n=1 Tax=Alkalihalobacterium alkalicellulosilyticum TaxID=1912214 RepID=UPI000996DBE5|nr:aromatic acid exporter family protein [Bacillus alkalicellulosilyticus]